MSSPSEKPLIEYPTVYAYKVMGRPGNDFHGYVRSLFARLLGVEVTAEAIAENRSRQGTYVSLTVTVVLTSEEQRQTVYRHLHQDPRVVYYL